jgi:omega-hydroxy-beta-dihydromenaquinone-9 sulfotransferase
MSNQPGIWARPLFNCSLRGWRRQFARYPERIDRRLRMRALVTGGLASALESMQERLFGARLDSIVLEDPIFIVGHWRSGTTLLHELMALDERLLSPTTRQCFNPQSFLLGGTSRQRGAVVVRPSGDRAVSADSPQEEEFALLCLGCASPYEAFVFPRALNHISALCDPQELTALERTDWERRLVRFLKAVTLAGGSRRLLLKSPSNSFRIAALRRLFPNAAFIQIIREPTPVIVSTMHMWMTMWERYALGPAPEQSALQDLAIDTWLHLENKLQSQAQPGLDGALTIVRYEDLVAQPHRTIEHIYAELRLGAGPSEDRISQFLQTSPPLRPSHPVTAAQAALVRERCAAIFDRYGYKRQSPISSPAQPSQDSIPSAVPDSRIGQKESPDC